MKSLIRTHVIACIAAFGLFSGMKPAQAIIAVPTGPITVTLQGSLGSVDPVLAGTFSNGQAITVTYTFNPTTPALAGATDTQATYDALTSFNFTVGSYSATSAASQEIQVDNNPPAPDDDRYAVVSRASDGLTGADVNGNTLDGFTFRLDDINDEVFNSTALPTNLSLSSFTSNEFFLTFDIPQRTNTPSDATMALVTGTFTSLSFSTNPPVVPEPATLGLISLGLSGVGLLRRRKLA